MCYPSLCYSGNLLLRKKPNMKAGWHFIHSHPHDSPMDLQRGLKKNLQNNSNPDTFFYRIKKKNSKHETKKPHHYKKIYSCFLLL